MTGVLMRRGRNTSGACEHRGTFRGQQRAGGEASGGPEPAASLEPGLSASRTGRKSVSSGLSPSLWYCYGGPSKLRHHLYFINNRDLVVYARDCSKGLTNV